MVTADAVVNNCPQGCVLQMAALPQEGLRFFRYKTGSHGSFPASDPLTKFIRQFASGVGGLLKLAGLR